MTFGMTTFTFVHVLLSLIGIFSGFVVVFGLLVAKRLDGWTTLFLASTVLTSVTGFLFPFHGFCRPTESAFYLCSRWQLRSSPATAVTSPAYGVGPTRSRP